MHASLETIRKPGISRLFALQFTGILGCAILALAAPAARGDHAIARIDPDLTNAISISPSGVPAFLPGSQIPIDVYVKIVDIENDGYDSQGLVGIVFSLITDTGIPQNNFQPSLTESDGVARTNHETWLETNMGAFFVGGFGFDFYSGGSANSTGTVYGVGLFLPLIWYADVSSAMGLQPYGLHGVGIGNPPGVDVGGHNVGNRPKWYMMASTINVPTVPGFYEARLEIEACNVIPNSKNLYADVTDGYATRATIGPGEAFIFQAGAGSSSPGIDPVAVITLDHEFGDAPLTVEFDAAESYDLDGSIADYRWDFGDGSAVAFGAAVQHTFVDDGYHDVTLDVFDNTDRIGTARQMIAVNVNAPPSADISALRSTGTWPLQVQFDGGHSRDPEGGAVFYQWDFGDGTSAVGPTQTHHYTSHGVFLATLTVTDDEGASDEASFSVIVENQPPFAGFSMTPGVGEAPAEIRFDAGASVDPEGSALLYYWDFGDGATAAGRTTRHVYETPGVYNVALKVIDSDSAERTAGRSLRVLLPDGRVLVYTPNNKTPNVGLSAGPSNGPAPLTVNFGITGTDPDGDQIAIVLNTGQGEQFTDLQTGDFVSVVYDTPGQYVAEATSYDGRGGTAKTQVTVTVEATAGVTSGSNSPNASRGSCGTGIAQAAALGLAGLTVAAVRRKRRRYSCNEC